MEYLDWFRILEFLNSFAFELSNVHTKRVYLSLSQRCSSALVDAVRVMEATGQKIRGGPVLLEERSCGL